MPSVRASTKVTLRANSAGMYSARWNAVSPQYANTTMTPSVSTLAGAHRDATSAASSAPAESTSGSVIGVKSAWMRASTAKNARAASGSRLSCARRTAAHVLA